MASGGVDLSEGAGLEDQPTSVPENTIEVNYGDGWTYCELPRQTRVESILANAHVVLFGEGNLTFTFALAALQGGWSRILSTRFEPATKNKPLPDFTSIQLECVKNCVDNGKKLEIAPHDIIKNIKIITSLTAPVFALCGIDATRRAFMEGKVAWFQCPWISLRGGPYEAMITAFLNNMARQQMAGDYVLIGIITYFPYVKSYNLGKLLDLTLTGLKYKKASKKCSTCPWYAFIGADDTFIERILQFGYHHKNADDADDIHERIFNDHLTLIFQRNDLSANEV